MDKIQKDNIIKDKTEPPIIKDKGHQPDYVLLKTQKLTSALYLITDFLSDLDPIKWKIRDRALSLMSDINFLNQRHSVNLIEQILSFIDIVLLGSSVSEMNFSLLKKEYQNLREILLRQTPHFDLALSPARPALREPGQKLQLAAQNKPQNGLRRQAVLQLVRDRGQCSIAEIAAAVPGVSSKTIQRELVELVRVGILKKIGEKRWSRYAATD